MDKEKTMTLQELNETRWKNCHVPSDRGPAFEAVANRIKNNKAVYQKIEKETGVPWWFIGITHYREANLDMNANLAQGDPWRTKSRHVPVGRGPFNSFEEAAVDALVNCSPHAAQNKDWSVGGALTMFEKYNGLGYAKKNVPSPYVWAGTDQYVHGKYVADGVYDDTAVDKQLGCAGLLKFLGIFPTSKSINPVTTIAIGGAAAGGVAVHNYWSFVQTHWIALTVGLIATAFIIDFIVYKLRKTNNV